MWQTIESGGAMDSNPYSVKRTVSNNNMYGPPINRRVTISFYVVPAAAA